MQHISVNGLCAREGVYGLEEEIKVNWDATFLEWKKSNK